MATTKSLLPSLYPNPFLSKNTYMELPESHAIYLFLWKVQILPFN